MRRLFVLSVLALGLGGSALQAQPAKKRVPPKKPSAGQSAARTVAPHAPTKTVVRKPIPARSSRPSDADVIEAGHKAAAAAAAERVHAWLRDHGEIADDEPVASPAPPVRRPAVTAGKSTLPAAAPTGAEPAKGSDKKATTDDFVKAAEKRKKLEVKEHPATGVSRPPGEDNSEPESSVTPASSIPMEKPAAQKVPATDPDQAVALQRAAAKPATSVARVAGFEEDELEAAPVEEPAVQRQHSSRKALIAATAPEQPLPSAKAAAKDLEAKAKKEAPTEKEAREKSSAPVLAVKRAVPVEEEPVTTSVIQPKLTFRRGRLVVPAPLLGSHAILVRQNEVADKYGLERIQDDDDLIRLRKSRDLVPLPNTSAMQIDDRLEESRRYARPWAVKFLNDLGRAHQLRFHGSLQVNSAVRTVAFQQRLLRTNGNAAPAEGDTASPHLTGQAIDLAKHGLSMTEIAWLRAYLLPLVQQGKIDVEEEFQQACFHISIYKSYAPEAKKPGKGGRRLEKALAVGLP